MNKGLKSVIFIEGLITKKVMATDNVEYIKAQGLGMTAEFSEDTALLDSRSSKTENRRIVPVTSFFGINGREDDFAEEARRVDSHIAYSEEVEELLGIPIRILLREAKESRAESRAYQADSNFLISRIKANEDSFLRRLKFLFTGRLR